MRVSGKDLIKNLTIKQETENQTQGKEDSSQSHKNTSVHKCKHQDI